MLDHKDDYNDALVVNRFCGGRLSVLDGVVAEGSQVIVVRSSSWDTNRPQRWRIKKVATEGGHNIVHIERSDDKGNVFRVGLNADKPQVENTRLVLKKPDDSDEQKWSVLSDYATDSALHQLMPYADRTLAASVQDIGNLSWGHVVLSRSFSSVDRLWYFNDWSYKKEIPH